MNKKLEPHINSRLIRRLKMLGTILLIMAAVAVYEIFLSQIRLYWVLLALLIGLLVGYIVDRSFAIEWHAEREEVVGRLDLIGGIILALYIILSMARHWIFSHWFAGAKLTAFTFSFAEGVMLGRLFSLRFNIKKVLSDNGKI